MRILLSNNQSIQLEINDNPLGLEYQKIYKHLSHVLIPWKKWDNPFYLSQISYLELVDELDRCAKLVSIKIDRDRCLLQDQEHFNFLHKIYEKNYNGDSAWLDFHEYIHMCEIFSKKESKKFFCIDYREKAGLSEKPMLPKWRNQLETSLLAGQVFVAWSELGKNPYAYWRDNEPEDIERMCELVKPWLKLRPKIYIALEDTDRMHNIMRDEFESWWKSYHDSWCHYWNIPQWTLEDMFGVSVLGHTKDYDELTQALIDGAVPVKVLVE